MFYFVDNKIFFNGFYVADFQPQIHPRVRQELEDELQFMATVKEDLSNAHKRLDELERSVAGLEEDDEDDGGYF